jgi:tetraacyldisaccharide 4'-kinase
MDEASFLRLVRGETRGVRAALARIGLSGVATAYGLGVSLRTTSFDQGWKREKRARIPIVSVGNLTLGGTGKTPMVEWLARWFRLRGIRVAILSRGYGSAAGLNDEGLVLDQNLPDVPHLQAANRVQLARIAAEELEAQAAILDDGFQHRRLARDLDLVLLDALEPFGLNRLFPAGLLREPIRALRRADLVVLSRANLISEGERISIRRQAELAAGPLDWLEAEHQPRDLINSDGGSEDLQSLCSTEVAAFCGIGNPEAFRRTLLGLGARIRGFRSYPDHHPYSRTDVFELIEWVKQTGARLALTTQKDLVKLRIDNLALVPLRALRIGLCVSSGQQLLDTHLQRVLEQVSND